MSAVLLRVAGWSTATLDGLRLTRTAPVLHRLGDLRSELAAAASAASDALAVIVPAIEAP